MARNRFDPLPPEAFVFRLAEHGKFFKPENDPPLLTEAFRPSSEDEKEGKENNRPPGVSVWDHELTKLSDAKRMRFSPNAPPDNVRAFGLKTETIIKLGEEFKQELAVVAVPYPTSMGPGADGHSHIEGLKRLPRKKAIIQRLRLALVDEALKNEVV